MTSQVNIKYESKKIYFALRKIFKYMHIKLLYVMCMYVFMQKKIK